MYGDETFGQLLAATATYGYHSVANGNAGKDRRTSASLSTGSYSGTYQCDVRGRLVSDLQTIDGLGYRTAYTYDTLDRPRTQTYPKLDPTNPAETPQTVYFTYNARTLPATTRGTWGSITGIAYSPLGKPTKVSNGGASTPTTPTTRTTYS